MATLLIIAQIIGMLISIPSWITKIMELISLIRRLPKAERVQALLELKGHTSNLRAEVKGQAKVSSNTVYPNIQSFEVGLKARLKDS